MQKLNKKKIYEILSSRFNGEFLTLKDLPQPNTLKDMQKGVDRVVRAIKNNQKIALIGDYDVDGVTATTVVREFFRYIDYKLDWVIPNRFKDGYGISKSVIDRVDAELIITVDNGVAAIEPAKICKDRGIDLIITDHHTCGEILPDSYALINQKQSDCTFEYKEICGAQIAWYFVGAIAKELGVDFDKKEQLSIVAIAIVADVMPLNGINRAMLIAGLKLLNRSNRAFVRALKSRMNFKEITSETIAFYIAPLINSAGRLKDASIASNFLFTEDFDEALMLLDELISFNKERREIERNISQKAFKQVKKDDNIAIVWGEEWNEGVVGIVAARVAEHFKIPAIALSCKDDICKGSGRAYGDCNLFELVSKAKRHYLKFGGHKSALGLSFKREKLDTIKNILNAEAKDCNKDYIDKSIIGELPFSEIDFELLDILEMFEPYGEANSKPKFITKNVKVVEVREIGESREHKRFRLMHENKILTAIEFKSKSSVRYNDRIDVIYMLNRNEFNGNIYINLYIENIL